MLIEQAAYVLGEGFGVDRLSLELDDTTFAGVVGNGMLACGNWLAGLPGVGAMRVHHHGNAAFGSEICERLHRRNVHGRKDYEQVEAIETLRFEVRRFQYGERNVVAR